MYKSVQLLWLLFLLNYFIQFPDPKFCGLQQWSNFLPGTTEMGNQTNFLYPRIWIRNLFWHPLQNLVSYKSRVKLTRWNNTSVILWGYNQSTRSKNYYGECMPINCALISFHQAKKINLSALESIMGKGNGTQYKCHAHRQSFWQGLPY